MFDLKAQDGEARAGVLKTEHGEIQTPMFMPVGTRASVKSLWQEDLEELEAQIILGNTYHLFLKPGHELIEKLGGLHKFMSWDKPILTDSGGFQVFSLSDLNKVSEEGVEFRSHIDGAKKFISPEESMRIQRALGSDIVMAFDECPALPASDEILRTSMELTLRWAKRCKTVELKSHQHLFGIVQGGLNLDMRKECMQRLLDIGFDGYAVGGLSVGEKNEQMKSLCYDFVPHMPQNQVRYLMGVGKPLDILEGIRSGLDIFDCVLPTRNARNGQFLTSRGPMNIKNARFLEDQSAPDKDCDCRVCKRYTRAYIRHLYTVGEYLAGQLISYHNIYFYLKMVKEARIAIVEGKFEEYYQDFKTKYESKDF